MNDRPSRTSTSVPGRGKMTADCFAGLVSKNSPPAENREDRPAMATPLTVPNPFTVPPGNRELLIQLSLGLAEKCCRRPVQKDVFRPVILAADCAVVAESAADEVVARFQAPSCDG